MSNFYRKSAKSKMTDSRGAIADISTGALVTYKDLKDKRLAIDALDACRGVQQTQAARTTWQNISTNVSVRDSFNRSDYEYFRPEEAIPRRSQEIIAACMEAYRKVGIVRNVIDLMGDFGAQGIQLNHPNPRIQAFYRKWFLKVSGVERSERFLNLLYRCSNVVINRKMATIPADKLQNSRKFTSLGNEVLTDGPLPVENTTSAGVIPIQYTFLNPLSLEPIHPELANFIGKVIYGIRLPHQLVNVIKFPKTRLEKELVAQLPKDIISAANTSKIVPLDPTKIITYFYKKDDWQIWADPMIYAILSNLIVLEKMQMADLAALDGAISQIRVWKLGRLNDTHPEASVFPTEAAISKLADILLSNPGGGAFDLIWGPDLEVKDYTTNIHLFLGGAKYEPVLNAIYAGLGVPPTLTGAADAAGLTNNYISLKTLVQRLEYGRSALRDFWQKEIELVRQAMGFRIPATVTFDRMILSDEAAEKALIIQMVDRNLMSIEAAQERLGEDPDLEKLRLKREEEERQSGELVGRAGPWFSAEKNHELIKIALQRGFITPNEAGIPIEEEFDEPPFMAQIDKAKNGGVVADPKNAGVNGRPKNAKDTKPRDTRTPKPRSTGEDLEYATDFMTKLTWAKSAYKILEDICNPAFLSIYKKKNARMLSAEEVEACENMKFAIFASIEPFSTIDPKTVYSIIRGDVLCLPQDFLLTYNQLLTVAQSKLERKLNLDEIRNLQIATYSILKEC